MQQNAKGNVGRDGQAAVTAALEPFVKRSDSGQMSVSIDDVSKTPSFKGDLETLGRIRRLTQKSARRR